MRTSNSSAPASADFWQRWPHYRQPLLRLAQRFLGDQSSDAEDAVTTTLLRALPRLPSGSVGLSNERAWLIRILYNVCMDMHRYRRRFAEPAPSGSPQPFEEPPDEGPSEAAASPEEDVLAREQLLELQAHINALEDELRIPLLMRFEGMDYPDISAELNLTNSNARKRIQRAKDKLRASMGISSGISQLQEVDRPPGGGKQPPCQPSHRSTGSRPFTRFTRTS
jgi:RNA polymerase sigma-70 factor (ECF subfamily)